MKADNSHEARYCGAKTRNGGKCNKYPLKGGNGRCKLHNGGAPRGFANGNTKHGRYSKHLPTRLAADFERSVNDPELLSIRSDIALIDTRLNELVASIDNDTKGNSWGSVSKAWKALNIAMKTGDTQAVIKSSSELDDIIASGFQDYIVWQEIRQLLQERARLVSVESKRINDANLTITAERAMLLVSAIANVVMEHVTDNAIRAKINRGIDTIIASDV